MQLLGPTSLPPSSPLSVLLGSRSNSLLHSFPSASSRSPSGWVAAPPPPAPQPLVELVSSCPRTCRLNESSATASRGPWLPCVPRAAARRVVGPPPVEKSCLPACRTPHTGEYKQCGVALQDDDVRVRERRRPSSRDDFRDVVPSNNN